MTIGIDASRANHAHKSGVEWYAFHLIQALKEVIPSEHRVLLYSDRPLEGSLGDLPKSWESRVLRAPFGRLWTITSLTAEMFFNPPDMFFGPAGMLPFVLPKRSATTIHDVTFLPHPDWYSWRDERAQNIALERARQTSAIIVPSDYTKDEMIHHAHFSADRIHVVPLAPDSGYAPGPADPSVLKKYGVGESYFIYVGRLDAKKNIEVLIRAFDILHHTSANSPELAYRGKLELVLVGAPGFGWKKIKQAIDASPARHAIKILGWVPQADTHALMRGASALVFPGAGEGFGLPALEAMASGVPVIAARAGSLPEVCGGAAHLAHPFDSEVWADDIHRVLTDKPYRQDLISRGLARAREFSWERTARETWEILST